jgi:hypothetical protein
VISGPYTKENVKNGKNEFSSRLVGDEITKLGYRVQTSAECKTVIIVMLSVTSGLESSLD